VPPIVDDTTVVLRTHSIHELSLAQFVEQGIVKPAQARALERAVRDRLNILIGGGTGSGKTTFVNALLGVLADSTDRVLTIEDTRELKFQFAHPVPVRVKKNLYSWQDALIDAMRMRPDRIIVGELREGAAAIEFLAVLNTGHPGTVATLHADSAAQMLDRFCRLMEQVVQRAPREEVASAIHFCVHMQKDDTTPAGRVVTDVLRVHGFVPEIDAEERRRYQQQGIDVRRTVGGFWLLQSLQEIS
jgi:Flp pilus assembly CpaF family ATPase